MAKNRTQLNINIDPELLLKLKSEATKNGKTLTKFVTDQLEKMPISSDQDSLEQRLNKIEEYLHLTKGLSVSQKQMGSIFTDNGAKKYGQVAKKLFDAHLDRKKMLQEDGLQELAIILKKYPNSNPELVFGILLGIHDLTGLEMTRAYRYGSCAMRSALSDWCKDSLEPLNEAFLSAVITKSLA